MLPFFKIVQAIQPRQHVQQEQQSHAMDVITVVADDEESIPSSRISKTQTSGKTNVVPWLQSPQQICTQKYNKITLVSSSSSSSSCLEEEETIQEPTPHLLEGITHPLLRKSIWRNLTGREFYYPSTLRALAHMGIQLTSQLNTQSSLLSNDGDSTIIQWKPDTKTKQLMELQEKHPQEPILSNALQLQDDQGQAKDGHVLLWIGYFQSHPKSPSSSSSLEDRTIYHGMDLPLIRTHSIINMSPRDLAQLLMNSKRVQEYNKMSLGRTDEVVFQHDIDTHSHPTRNQDRKGGLLEGEAKIVRNRSKPPISKQILEFITLMYARRLTVEDPIGSGIFLRSFWNQRRKALSSTHCSSPSSFSSSSCDDSSPLGYIIVSRAVTGGPWSPPSHKNHGTPSTTLDITESNHLLRSEILLGVNLLRSVPNHPNLTELTAVTHVYSPSVPQMLATTVGVKGAINFVHDLRSLSKP